MNLSILSPLLRAGLMRKVSRQALLQMEPETAHRATIAALKLGLVPDQRELDPVELRVEICGLEFSNPIAMAAGFDKNAEVPGALGAIGFGAVEVGTLTPRSQSGNPKPRLFRLEGAEGVINRMGFNNDGHDEVYRRLQGRRFPMVLGINIGANKTSDDFVADYVQGVKRFAGQADYLTANISSPNTPGLRDLQSSEALKRLLGEVLAERARAKVRVPVFLKLAPDLEEKAIDDIVKVVAATDLDGLIISNTTLDRTSVADSELSSESGGLSGKPLFNHATQKLAQVRLRVGNDMPIIGVGGIHSTDSAVAKFSAGANVIQLYTALVFGGMELLEDLKAGLLSATRKGGHKTVAGLTSTDVEGWASGKLHI